MREIKFKIYDKELKETHIEELQDLCEDDYWYDGETDMWSVLYDGTHEQERFVISLYTGLKDKNGVEIYEGDIVSIHERNIFYIVEWHDTGLKGRQYNNQSYIGLEYWKNIMEVIGNIYENKDLLEGE